MRHAASVFAIAAVIVGLWYVLAGSVGTAAGPLMGADLGLDEDAMAPDGPRAATRSSAVPSTRGMVAKPKKPGLVGMCEEHGLVGKAVYGIIRKSVGQDARMLDRSFARKEIWQIITAWAEDPTRKDGDIDFLVKVWDEMKDPTARYALSWLFRYAKDDRVIEPLKELVPHHPWQAVDSIAAQGSDLAASTLVDLKGRLQKPEVRNQATIRIARSGWTGAVEHLRDVWTGERTATDYERFVAVEALARIPDDREARIAAFEIANGPSRPLSEIGDRDRDHPARDLRSAAVMAVMQSGDLTLTRKLLTAADAGDRDAAFVAMVDLHIGSFTGGNMTQILFERSGRRRKVTLGEARYFNRVCTSDDIARLRQLEALAVDAQTRQLMQAAILNARTR